MSAKPGHDIYMAAIEVNRLLTIRHMHCLSPVDIEAAITKGLFGPDGPPPEDELNRLRVAIPDVIDWVKRAMSLLDDRQAEIRKIQQLRSDISNLSLDGEEGE